MVRKTYFEKLNPSEQVAIETQLQKVKKEDLENCWKEMKAKETENKGNGFVVLFFVLLMLAAVVFLFMPMIEIDNLKYFIKTSGSAICKMGNGTYVSTTFSLFTSKPTVICSNNVFRGNE